MILGLNTGVQYGFERVKNRCSFTHKGTCVGGLRAGTGSEGIDRRLWAETRLKSGLLCAKHAQVVTGTVPTYQCLAKSGSRLFAESEPENKN